VIPAWIVGVLDKHLPDLKGGQRDEIAEALFDAATSSPAIQEAIVKAIANSAHTVLEQRCIRDGGREVSSEIANNSAASVLFALGEG
jgi:hypothetical protein